MGRRATSALLALVAAIALAACGSTDSRTAPAFSLPNLDGGAAITNASLAGTPTVVNFWASWCGPCREEMPALAAFAKNSATIAVVGIATSDDRRDAKRFAEEVGVDYRLAVDADGELLGKFGATGLPATFVLDSAGQIVRTHFGAIDREELDALVAGVS